MALVAADRARQQPVPAGRGVQPGFGRSRICLSALVVSPWSALQMTLGSLNKRPCVCACATPDPLPTHTRVAPTIAGGDPGRTHRWHRLPGRIQPAPHVLHGGRRGIVGSVRPVPPLLPRAAAAAGPDRACCIAGPCGECAGLRLPQQIMLSLPPTYPASSQPLAAQLC